MDLVGISLMIIALAFVALVIFLIIVLKKVSETIDEAKKRFLY
ncbi:PF06103 domain protein [Streptococcus pyogenes GA40468]|nr:PF06103 domain protein [Streptococcus pyogenes GA40468]ESA50553.1 PF06103 domain protein [Streptococcus pyogenes GA41208]